MSTTHDGTPRAISGMIPDMDTEVVPSPLIEDGTHAGTPASAMHTSPMAPMAPQEAVYTGPHSLPPLVSPSMMAQGGSDWSCRSLFL